MILHISFVASLRHNIHGHSDLLQVIEGWHGGAPEGVDLLQKPGLRCGVVGQVVDGESQGTGRCLVPSIHEHADLSADLHHQRNTFLRVLPAGPPSRRQSWFRLTGRRLSTLVRYVAR